MDYIGRSREWREHLIYLKRVTPNDSIDVKELLKETSLQGTLKRKSDLLISLLTGSINDIEKIGAEQPEELLDKVKKKIVLFDGEQTRFIYRNYAVKKMISVQGLSGTGKTELLLHKLKELYINDDTSRIYLVHPRIALASLYSSIEKAANSLSLWFPNHIRYERMSSNMALSGAFCTTSPSAVSHAICRCRYSVSAARSAAGCGSRTYLSLMVRLATPTGSPVMCWTCCAWATR